MLGYAEPRKAIGKIHERNKARLDKFSSDVKLTTEAGERTATVYSFKGLLEICRYSNQPKADAVMDFLWDVADEIRKTGSYGKHLSPEEILLEQVKALVEHKRRLETVESKIGEIEAKLETRPEHCYTVAGYASLRGINVDVNKANMLGRKAAKLSREYGYEISKTPDPRFGTVNIYHEDILKEVFRK